MLRISADFLSSNVIIFFILSANKSNFHIYLDFLCCGEYSGEGIHSYVLVVDMDYLPWILEMFSPRSFFQVLLVVFGVQKWCKSEPNTVIVQWLWKVIAYVFDPYIVLLTFSGALFVDIV